MLLGLVDDARISLSRARAADDATIGARSSTIRQLEQLLQSGALVLADATALLEVIRPGPIAHYCGHIFEADPLSRNRSLWRSTAR